MINIICFCAFLLLSYFSRSRFYLSTVDPLKIIAITDALVGVSGIQLALSASAQPQYIITIFTTLIVWWLCWLILGCFFGIQYRNSALKLLNRLVILEQHKQYIIIGLTLLLLLMLTSIALITSSLADSRILLYKQFRLVEAVITCLLPISCFWLIPKVFYKRGYKDFFLLFLLVSLRLLSGGKSSVLFIFYPVSWLLATQKLRVSLKQLLLPCAFLLFLVFLGSSVAFSSYSDTSFIDLYINAFNGTLNNYYLPFQEDMVSYIRISSLVGYLMSPLSKLVWGREYEIPNIGAAIQGAYYNVDSISGPQPHWSIILSSAQINDSVNIVLISSIVFCSVIGSLVLITRSKLAIRLPVMVSVPMYYSLACYTPQVYYDFSLYLVSVLSGLIVSLAIFIIITLFSQFSTS